MNTKQNNNQTQAIHHRATKDKHAQNTHNITRYITNNNTQSTPIHAQTQHTQKDNITQYNTNETQTHTHKHNRYATRTHER